MERIKILTVALVLIAGLTGIAPAAIVAYYDFNGHTMDASGNGLDGISYGQPGFVPGLFGQAISLDGIDDHVDCGSDTLFAISDEITIAAWVNLSSLPGDWRTIVSRGESSWRVSTYQSEARCHFSIEGAPNNTAVQSDTLLEPGYWYHICAVYDSFALRIYVNGQLERETVHSGTIGVNPSAVFIGDDPETPGRFWHGLIDELSIYDHALTAVEIEALAVMPVDTTRAFTYQGRLLHENGPADGLYDLEFSLFDSGTGGTRLGWKVGTDDVEVIEGYFTALLDFGAEVFDGYPRWLQIGVRPGDQTGDYTILEPRQPITPAPYAIHAKESARGADNDWEISGSDVYRLSGNVGIGTTTPTAGLHIADPVTAKLKLTATDDAHTSQLFDDGNLHIDGGGQNMWIDPSGSANLLLMNNTQGNVGIGTYNPGAKLTVESSSDQGIRVESLNETAVSVYSEGGFGVYAMTRGSSVGGVVGAHALTGSTGILGERYTGVYGGGPIGVYGTSVDGRGVRGESGTDIGVYGESISGEGVYGENSDTGNTGILGGSWYGAYGKHNSSGNYGLLGVNEGGVYGYGQAGKDDFYAAGPGNNYGAASSIRWKRDIRPIDDPLGMVSALRGVYFDWDPEHGGQHDMGMIAEEVGAVLPEIVTYEDNGTDAVGMDYSKLTPLLVEAVKELDKEKDRQISVLQKENAALKEQLAEANARVADLAEAQSNVEDRIRAIEAMVSRLAVGVKGGLQ